METTMIVLVLVLALVALVVASAGIVLAYRISKRMPKMHYDEKDGVWRTDGCIVFDDGVTWGDGSGIWFNYKKRRKE